MNLAEAYLMRGPVWWLQHHIGYLSPTRQQIMVLENTSRKRVAIGDRRSGKTALLCLDAIEKAHSNPGCSIMMVGAFDRQSDYLVRMLSEILDRSNIPVRTSARDRIVFMNGSVITFREANVNVNRMYGQAADFYYVDDFESVHWEMLMYLNDLAEVGNSNIMMAGLREGLSKLACSDSYNVIEFYPVRVRDHSRPQVHWALPAI